LWVSRSFIFLDVLPDCKFDIAQELKYLYFEAMQSDGYLTTATSVSMNSFAIFISVVMLKRVNETEEIVEHEDPTGGSLAASSYVRHACLTLVSAFPHSDKRTYQGVAANPDSCPC